MDSQKGKTVYIVSTRALKELEDRLFKHLSLEMSWSNAPHEVRIKTIAMGAAVGACSPIASAALPGLGAAIACLLLCQHCIVTSLAGPSKHHDLLCACALGP